MNNWCICWFSTHIFTGILIFKGPTVRRLYKSFGVEGLNERKLLTSQGTVSFSRTAVLYELATNYDCENVTNSHFLCTSIYLVSSCVTSRVGQAPGVCALDVEFSRDSLTHRVVISFVCSLSRSGMFTARLAP
jgi:hypothetical protein